jgi:hypothetical protein
MPENPDKSSTSLTVPSILATRSVARSMSRDTAFGGCHPLVILLSLLLSFSGPIIRETRPWNQNQRPTCNSYPFLAPTCVEDQTHETTTTSSNSSPFPDLTVQGSNKKNERRDDDLSSQGNSGNSIFPYFQHIPQGLRHFSDSLRPIPFQEEWLNDFNVSMSRSHDMSIDATANIPPPEYLSVPDFVDVFQLKTTSNIVSLQNLGREARHIIDLHLDQGSGCILFRYLQSVIHNASDFAKFWSHVIIEDEKKSKNNPTKSWGKPMADHLSCYNRKRQHLHESGVHMDRVDTDVPEITIGPHNEHSCNPYPSEKISFYALHAAAKGGETLLRRNQDIQVPDKAWKLLHTHGGLQFQRSYPHEDVLRKKTDPNRHPTEMSWQERCQTYDPQLARDYFAQHHGITNISIDPNDGTLRAHNILKGYYNRSAQLQEQEQQRNNGDDSAASAEEKTIIPNSPLSQGGSSSENVWFNRIDYGFPVTMADGTIFPYYLQSILKRQKWHETYAFKLQPGDWFGFGQFACPTWTATVLRRQ